MPSRLLLASSCASFALLILLGIAYVRTDSNLSLAQAVDSLADVLSGIGLLWALRLSLKPADANHHYGHHGAQPIAAVMMATLIGVMAIEVLWSAVEALVFGHTVHLTPIVAIGLGLKVAVKVVFVLIASRRKLSEQHQTLHAFVVDARSDVIVGIVSLLGYVGSTFGDTPSLDAWLAIPAALWVGYSGFELARDNIELLMGTAPPPAWRDALVEDLATIPGVARVGHVKARTSSDGIQTWVEILVAPELPIARAHDIGEAVEARLLRRDDVCDAVVHVDADLPRASGHGPDYGPPA